MKTKVMIISFLFIIAGTFPLLAQSESRVWQDILYSDALMTMKSFHIYLPEGYDESNERYPVVYFLHPEGDNWFNPYVRGRSHTLKDIADSLIASGHIGKMILVDPALGDNYMAIPGMPNMLRPDLTSGDGIGTGKFEDYLVNDLIPYVDSHYRTMADHSRRGIDGFDLGGYAAVLSAVKHPELFSSVGSYDAPFMWYDLDDPMGSGNTDDSLWVSSGGDSICGATFNMPRNIDYMEKNNAVNLIKVADEATLESIRTIRFHIQASNPDGLNSYEITHSGGLLSRSYQFIKMLASKNILNTFDEFALADAKNNWHSAFLHASQSLIKHWESFQEKVTSLAERSAVLPKTVYLGQNYPNPFNPATQISFSIAKQVDVKLTVFDMLGRMVAILVDKKMTPGQYNVTFNAGHLPSGTYFYQLLAGDFVQTKKLMLVK